MKKFFKILTLLLAFSFLLTALAACNNTETPDDGEDENKNMEITGYTVVRSDTAIKKITNITALLKNSILEKTEAELSVITDYESETEYEILVGNTNRKESTDALNELKKTNKKEAFIIKVYDKKIAIVGISDDDTMIGVKRFINEIVGKSEKKNTIPVTVGYSMSDKTGELIYSSEDNELVVLEALETIYSPETKMSSETATYGKIIKLENNGDNNGILLATREPGSKAKYPIYKSTDDGETWEEISLVGDTVNDGCILGYQPYLYELPADIGEYKKGTILFAGCTRVGSQENTRMVLSYSTDVGKTWTTLYNIDEGGGYNQGDWSSEGLWEPFLIYEEETKRLYCFYSDETDSDHNQKLVYKYTTDMKTWSEKFDCTALDEANYRPGMVTIAKMGNGKYALAFEIINLEKYHNGQIYLKIADSLDSWDVNDMGKPIYTDEGIGLASAPAIAWTPNGGECGTLFVTSHHNLISPSNTKCDLFISFDYGETFISIDNPIPLVDSALAPKGGYSPGFYVDKEGTVYYVNNPEAFSKSICEKLMFARIKVY